MLDGPSQLAAFLPRMSTPLIAGSGRALFWAITWRVELFTYLVPVPVAVYFSLVGVPMSPEDRMVGLYAGVAMGTLMLALGMLWRFIRIRSICGRVVEAGARSRLKDDLLDHPRREAFVIALRWVVGMTLAHAAYAVFVRFEPAVHLSLPFALSAIGPVSALAYFMLSEGVIASALASSQLRDVELPNGRPINRTGTYGRILFTVLGLLLMPLSIMGYLLHQVVEGRIDLEHPLLHSFGMMGLFLIPAVIAALGVARAIRRGLAEANTTLSALGSGDFSVTAAALTADEFGEHAAHLDAVIARLRAMYGEIREMNVSLEHRVQERTAQLQATLAEVHALKTQQDGDYYLTSLLTAPLALADTQSTTVSVSTFVRQKKQFEFRNKQAEIGGDLCAAHQIELLGRPYVAFLNGDAMGKSIQGAGGAIVLGTVFKSIVSRTKVMAAYSEKEPEFWLRDCYLELQTVFESFDGLMLASAVVGLVDEARGVFYFFNAEHPHPVLYRAQQAQFLQTPGHLPKLGIVGVGDPLRVQVERLEPGDVVICGSDGRDDIQLEVTTDGRRRINHDETLFLRIVEEGKGMLPAVAAALSHEGELVDDCGLLSFRYDDGAAAAGVPADRPSRQKAEEAARSVREDLAAKRWQEAAAAALHWSEADPTSTEALFRAGYAHKLARRFPEAVRLAERCQLRDPRHVGNLVNLADAYRLTGATDAARATLAAALALAPDSTAAHSLERLLV